MSKRIIFLMVAALTSMVCSAQSTYTLEQILDSARQNNISIRNARKSIEAAQHQRKEAFTNFFPNVSGTAAWFNANRDMAKATVNPSDMISPEMGASLAQSMSAEALQSLGDPITVTMMKNGTIAGINAIQPVFAGGQIINGNRLAKIGEEVAQLQMQLSENEVEKTAEQYFWQIITLQEKLTTIAAVETLLKDIHKDVDVAVRAGVAMRNDLLQVQLRQNDTESQKLKVQNALTIMKLLLSQYCGLRDTSFVIVHPSLSLGDSSLKNSIGVNVQSPTGNVQRLPEYQLLGKQVEAANLERKLAVGQNLPSVSIGAGYNYHNMLDHDRTFAMVFATVSVPISDWWGGSHVVKRKKIEHLKAIEEQQDKAELLEIRMQKAYLDVVEARQQIDIAQRSIEQAEENLRMNRDYYRAGLSKMTDLLEAQLLYQQALDRRTDTFADYHNKLLEYRHATGE